MNTRTIHPHKAPKRGFTLIELLVVIVIIALLLSILMPALKKAKYIARLLIDKNNLKSLGRAMELYLTQNNDRFFPYPPPASVNPTAVNTIWLREIGEGIENIDEVRFCPETNFRIKAVQDAYAATPGTRWGSATYPWLWHYSTPLPSGDLYDMGSYGFNGWLYGDVNRYVPQSMATYPFASKNDVKIPSKTPLFFGFLLG